MAGMIHSRMCILQLADCNKIFSQTAKKLKYPKSVHTLSINQISRRASHIANPFVSQSVARYSISRSLTIRRHNRGMGCTLSDNGFLTLKLPSLMTLGISSVPVHVGRTIQTTRFLHTSLTMFEDDANSNNKRIPYESREEDAKLEKENGGNISPVEKQIGMAVTRTNIDVNLPEKHSADFPLDDSILSDSDEHDILAEREEQKVIEEFAEPPMPPSSYTLASYVEHSEVLQKLVELGVDLSKVQQRQGVANELLRMTFDPQIKEKVSFLHFVGVESDNLGKFLTKNPHILLEEQDNLEKRVKYLTTKKFSKAAIAQIVNRAPYFLCFSVERLDTRLAFYQQILNLTGNELRQIITACPKLVTHKISRAKENVFVLKEQFGFHRSEIKTLVLSHPRILTRDKYKLISIFDYLHNDMCIPHKLILQNHQVFNSRAFTIQERHQFLESVGRAQYDPTQPGYISLKQMVTLPDDVFCEEIAKATIKEYNNFLKTL